MKWKDIWESVKEKIAGLLGMVFAMFMIYAVIVILATAFGNGH